MRVAYICADPGIPVRGSKGASIHVQQIVRAFQRRGDEVTVYATRGGDGPAAALGGARVVLTDRPGGAAPEREQAIAAAAAELAQRAREDGCDLVYERYALFSDAALHTGAPAIVEVNAPLIQEQRDYRTLHDEARAVRTTEHLFRGADVVTCVSAPVAAWTRTHGAAGPLVVPNGVDTSRFFPSALPEGPLRAVFLGSLKPWHGVETAIDALAGVRGIELSVLGDGPERAALDARARDRGVPVRWLGAVPHAEVPGVLSGMHVGLAPYPAGGDAYFSPLKVYEYLAAGLAVVASDTGQLPSIIEQDRTGLLVRPGDPGALRDALMGLRDAPERIRRLGAAARQEACAHHDWSRVLERILSARGLPTPTAGPAVPAEAIG